jgi:hypothetical protein
MARSQGHTPSVLVVIMWKFATKQNTDPPPQQLNFAPSSTHFIDWRACPPHLSNPTLLPWEQTLLAGGPKYWADWSRKKGVSPLAKPPQQSLLCGWPGLTSVHVPGLIVEPWEGDTAQSLVIFQIYKEQPPLQGANR